MHHRVQRLSHQTISSGHIPKQPSTGRCSTVQGAGQRNVGSHSKAVQKWKLCQDCVSSMAKRWCSSMFFTKPRIKGSNSHSCAASHGFHFSSLLSFASLLSSRGKSCKRTEALAPSCRDIHFLLSINTQGTIHCPANALGQLLQMVHVVWSRELQFSRQQWFACSATMSQAGAFLCMVETAGGQKINLKTRHLRLSVQHFSAQVAQRETCEPVGKH